MCRSVPKALGGDGGDISSDISSSAAGWSRAGVGGGTGGGPGGVPSGGGGPPKVFVTVGGIARRADVASQGSDAISLFLRTYEGARRFDEVVIFANGAELEDDCGAARAWAVVEGEFRRGGGTQDRAQNDLVKISAHCPYHIVASRRDVDRAERVNGGSRGSKNLTLGAAVPSELLATSTTLATPVHLTSRLFDFGAWLEKRFGGAGNGSGNEDGTGVEDAIAQKTFEVVLQLGRWDRLLDPVVAEQAHRRARGGGTTASSAPRPARALRSAKEGSSDGPLPPVRATEEDTSATTLVTDVAVSSSPTAALKPVSSGAVPPPAEVAEDAAYLLLLSLLSSPLLGTVVKKIYLRDPIVKKKGKSKLVAALKTKIVGDFSSTPQLQLGRRFADTEKAAILAAVSETGCEVRRWSGDNFADQKGTLPVAKKLFGKKVLRTCVFGDTDPADERQLLTIDDLFPVGEETGSSHEATGRPGSAGEDHHADVVGAGIGGQGTGVGSATPTVATRTPARPTGTPATRTLSSSSEPVVPSLAEESPTRTISLAVRVGMDVAAALKLTSVLAQKFRRGASSETRKRSAAGRTWSPSSSTGDLHGADEDLPGGTPKRSATITLFVFGVFVEAYPDVVRFWQRRGFDVQPRGERPDPYLLQRSKAQMLSHLLGCYRAFENFGIVPKFLLADRRLLRALSTAAEHVDFGWQVVSDEISVDSFFVSAML